MPCVLIIQYFARVQFAERDTSSLGSLTVISTFVFFFLSFFCDVRLTERKTPFPFLCIYAQKKFESAKIARNMKKKKRKRNVKYSSYGASTTLRWQLIADHNE